MNEGFEYTERTCGQAWRDVSRAWRHGPDAPVTPILPARNGSEVPGEVSGVRADERDRADVQEAHCQLPSSRSSILPQKK
jgi:hypothetical protein